MKRIPFIILPFCLYLSCSKSNSTSPSTPTPVELDTLHNWVKSSQISSELDDIWFTDNKNGFSVSATSMFSSTDSGNNWIKIPNTDNFKVFNIQFVDNQYGFVQGTGQLGITRDGGKNWSVKSINSGYAYTFQFLSPSTGYYNDYNKGIYKTVDTGTTWTQILNGTGKGPNFIFDFVDGLNGFSMINANCSKTVDGGTSWNLLASNITSPDFSSFYKMQFLDTLNGYCGTPSGLFKTTDGGKSWNNALAKATTFMIPYFLDKNNGYCLAANVIYKTSDGGTNWTISCKLGTDDFSGMYFLDINTGWATTFGGYVLRLKS
jgi:photosystem II stability/assembly factor-like uncharacterized protein